MEVELPSLNKTEFAKNKYLATAWKSARSKWENRADTTVLPSGFRDEHAIAILAITSSTALYKTFNKAILEEQQEAPQCVNVYRGFRAIRYKIQQRKRALVWPAYLLVIQPKKWLEVWQAHSL
ncbi:hypothetical protein NDU88_008728 [Pleurodeles waltl]|uniref:NAD(P)(+)--arginine ADP-ribosyltransferase n=1 Tax=Pleurodeles waltl TaxID=8319 RepID=A0AAV7P040_PLEWA|nr:hypothetical protein NDU88_008728 [Pleurodeles waltl]